MSEAPRPALLEARDLAANLPGDAGPLCVLGSVSLTLEAGEIVDVAGPSGAGKTTLLRALALLLPQAAGELLLEGAPAASIGAERWRASVALLPQKPAIVPGDVAQNLALPWGLKIRRAETPPSAAALRDALDGVSLGDVALDRDAARLSVGQQARVALVRVLLTRPRVLLLDEPDAALDPASALVLAERIRDFVAAGGGVLRVRHRESDGLASRRLHLAAGQLSCEVAS